jgi:peroxiredoxin Q/BCP
MLAEGSEAPRFAAWNQDGKLIRLEDVLREHEVVLYFFPKDGTPGCTIEARGFRDLADAYAARGAVILGVSLDGERSHRWFREKENLPFDLLVDADQRICRLYDVKVRNFVLARIPDRVTYVIGRDGRIVKAFAQVVPEGHAAEVLTHCGRE